MLHLSCVLGSPFPRRTVRDVFGNLRRQSAFLFHSLRLVLSGTGLTRQAPVDVLIRDQEANMATMRVVQVSRPNGPFSVVERPMPAPGPGSVRIKVQACGICHSDSLVKE